MAAHAPSSTPRPGASPSPTTAPAKRSRASSPPLPGRKTARLRNPRGERGGTDRAGSPSHPRRPPTLRDEARRAATAAAPEVGQNSRPRFGKSSLCKPSLVPPGRKDQPAAREKGLDRLTPSHIAGQLDVVADALSRPQAPSPEPLPEASPGAKRLEVPGRPDSWCRPPTASRKPDLWGDRRDWPLEKPPTTSRERRAGAGTRAQ